MDAKSDFAYINQGLNSGIMKGFDEKKELFENSKKGAGTYDTIYHCTTAEKLFSILKSKEIWLSNLTEVNDTDEIKKIDDYNFKDKVFVACFTYENNIDATHWEEYGKRCNGVLFGLKKRWFERNAEGIQAERTFIFISQEAAHTKMITNCVSIISPYFYIIGFDFLKVIYDDKLVIKMKESNYESSVTYVPIAGILKKVQGLCQRDSMPDISKTGLKRKK